MQVLREQQLYTNFSKCDLCKDKIQYLGHVVSKHGILVYPDKIRATMESSVPNNVYDIESFMGITGYYQKFIEGFSKISYPINSLQKKVKSSNLLKNVWKDLIN